MAVYASICHHCHREHEYVQRIADRDNTPECCGTKTERILVAPMVSASIWTGHAGFTAHKEDGTPVFIESGTAYKKFLSDNNYMPASEAHAHADSSKERIKADRKKRTRKYLEERVAQLPT